MPQASNHMMELIDCTLLQTFDIKPADYSQAIKYYYIQNKRMPDGLKDAMHAFNGEQLTDDMIDPLLQLLDLGSQENYPWVLIQNQKVKQISSCGDTRGRVPLGSTVSTLVTIMTLGLTDQSPWACTEAVKAASKTITRLLDKELRHVLSQSRVWSIPCHSNPGF